MKEGFACSNLFTPPTLIYVLDPVSEIIINLRIHGSRPKCVRICNLFTEIYRNKDMSKGNQEYP